MSTQDTQAQQAQGVPAQDTLSVVRRFERMVGDYNCLFTEYQGKTMPADVYQRFTALREERIPTARKELADLLAAAPQAEPQPEREPLTDEQIEALPFWAHFVGLFPATRQEITRAIEEAHGIGTKGGGKP